MTAKRRLILDVDTGIDDAMAIAYAVNSPGIHLEGVTTTFGNTDLASATRNTLQILELAGRPNVPVAAGAARSLSRPYVYRGGRVHGENGLGNIELPLPKARPVAEGAVDFLIRMARENPGELTLVPVGPMTNLALVQLQAPDVLPLFREIVIMGGAVLHPGNVTPVSEANIWNDPEAARILFQSGANLKLVGLDVTMKTLLTEAMMDEIAARGGKLGARVMESCRHYLKAYHAFYPGIGGCALHDPLAVAVAEDPTLVRTERMILDVECGGEITRGQTIADRRMGRAEQPNVDVCLEVDEPRFAQRFMDVLTRGEQSLSA